MSQANKIYGFLTCADNLAADKALLLGVRHAEFPYRSVSVETILDRGHASATERLVESYHQFEPALQEILCEHVEDLHTGLRLAGGSKTGQTRLNTLNIIKRAGYCRLADMVVNMLHESATGDDAESIEAMRITEIAAEILMEQSELIKKDTPETESEPAEAAGLNNIGRKDQQRYIVLSALQKAVSQYGRVHYRKEVIHAAMSAIPANWDDFWQQRLEAHHPVGQTVRRFLERGDSPDLAKFCLSAFKNSSLRPTAARAINQSTNCEFLLEAARAFHRQSDPQIAHGLKLVKKPLWLSPEILLLNEYRSDDQSSLVYFIEALGVEREKIGEYLSYFIAEAAEPVVQKTLSIFNELGQERCRELMGRILVGGSEEAVLLVMDELIKQSPADLTTIMAKQLNSPYGRVRQKARGYYSKIAFEGYWRNFNRLTHRQRDRAGNAILKIDSEVPVRLRQKAKSEFAQQRLQTVLIMRLLRQEKNCRAELLDLAVDVDSKVRSCAVGALGELPGSDGDVVEQCLLGALKDSDSRVCANAVESLQQRGTQLVRAKIERLSQSGHNRIRANALKAMLAWKVESARKAVADMFNDPRPRHRKSAQWLEANIGDINSDDQTFDKEEINEYSPVGV